MSRPADRTVDRGVLFTRLLKRNAIRLALGLRPLDVRRLYFRQVTTLTKPAREEPFLTKNPIPTQAELEPTESEREKIWADAVARNAARTAQGLPERDVTLMVELGLTRHRSRAYQELLGPYLDVCLNDIQKPGACGPSSAEYRSAVAKAEAQLRYATGIVSPRLTMVAEVADMARHRT